MSHYNEDELSAYALRPEATDDRRTVEQHVSGCRDCRDALDVIEAFDTALHDPLPWEVADAMPFAEDTGPRDYERDSAARFRQALAAMLPVFERFRAGFTGKSSPVHFWWGSFDLAVTRFSGRDAPQHPGGVPGLPDRITRDAYSQEVSSAGFWAGGVTQAAPFFYSYAYPEPDGFRGRPLPAGGWNGDFQEFTLPYAEVRAAREPEALLTSFLQSTYDTAAELADWDRARLEREPVAP